MAAEMVELAQAGLLVQLIQAAEAVVVLAQSAAQADQVS